jgi:riboflavin synthase
MFTGIIEEIGTVISVKRSETSAEFKIKAGRVIENLLTGESVNTNGACLTVTELDRNSFTVVTVAETIRKTNLHELKPGSPVNLERAMRLSDRLNGHLVSGHIDGTGTILEINKEGNANMVTISADNSLMRYIIYKGSVAIDGISLTVADTGKESFKVSIIPYTAKDTTILTRKQGDNVNIECDVIGKYVEHFLNDKNEEAKSKIDIQYLKEHGFY